MQEEMFMIYRDKEKQCFCSVFFGINPKIRTKQQNDNHANNIIVVFVTICSQY